MPHNIKFNLNYRIGTACYFQFYAHVPETMTASRKVCLWLTVSQPSQPYGALRALPTTNARHRMLRKSGRCRSSQIMSFSIRFFFSCFGSFSLWWRDNSNTVYFANLRCCTRRCRFKYSSIINVNVVKCRQHELWNSRCRYRPSSARYSCDYKRAVLKLKLKELRKDTCPNIIFFYFYTESYRYWTQLWTEVCRNGFDQRFARQQLCKHGPTRNSNGSCIFCRSDWRANRLAG
jgi:hypothetical protein